jgi:four helix bundle protein
VAETISFEDLEVYKVSIALSDEIWKIYDSLSHDLKINLGSQLVRSTDSIGANIAEGYGRYHRKDQIKFQYYARGSLYETKHWLILLAERKIICKAQKKQLENQINVVGKMLNGYINYLKKTTMS